MQPPKLHEFAERTEGRRSHEDSAPVAAQEVDACEAAAIFFRDYAHERPEVIALWAFGVGFVLGWKLKPW